MDILGILKKNLIVILRLCSKPYMTVILKGFSMRFKMDNLYFIAFKRPDGNWWAFSDVISPEFRNLEFDSTYSSKSNFVSAANRKRYEVVATKNKLRMTVVNLATTDPAKENSSDSKKKQKNSKNENIARSILQIIQMISESIRFQTILNHCVTSYEKDDSDDTAAWW